MKSLICPALVLTLAVTAAAQAPIDGTWSGEIAGEAGAQKISLSLTTDGDKLTGSVVGSGVESGIQNGVVKGATITFKTVQNVNGGQQTVNCTGTILAGEIQMSCGPADAAPLEFSVRRDAQD
jgi:hypothetical protein